MPYQWVVNLKSDKKVARERFHFNLHSLNFTFDFVVNS